MTFTEVVPVLIVVHWMGSRNIVQQPDLTVKFFNVTISFDKQSIPAAHIRSSRPPLLIATVCAYKPFPAGCINSRGACVTSLSLPSYPQL